MDDLHKPDSNSNGKNERDGEEVIDLTQVVNDQEDDIIELDALVDSKDQQPQSEDDAIIELDAPVDDPDQTVSPDDGGVIDLMDAVEPGPTAHDDLKAVDAPVVGGDATEPLPVNVSEVQLEAALERVIEKTYAMKIEQLILQRIEKTVQREIEKIKKEILEDSDDMSA
jgi:hypothetical protein